MSEKSPDLQITPEQQVIEDSRKAEKKLKREINKEQVIKDACMRLTFGTNNTTQKWLDTNTSNYDEWNRIVSKLTEKFKDDNSIEWVLFNNPQVIKLISNIVNFQSRDLQTYKSKYQKSLIEKGGDENSEDEDLAKSFEEYKFAESSIENFENFILSDEWIAVIVNEVKRHINEETGEIYQNYPIDENILRLRLKTAWDTSLRRAYYQSNYSTEEEEKAAIENEKRGKIWDVLENKVDEVVWDFMKSWWENFDKELVTRLESLLSQKENNSSLTELLSNTDLKDEFCEMIRNKIKTFSEINWNINLTSLNTWNKQIDLQFKSYLFIFRRLFLSDKNNQWKRYNESSLLETKWLIYATDWNKDAENMIKDKNLLEKAKKAEKERIERDRKRRQEIAKKNKEINQNFTSGEWIISKNSVVRAIWSSWDLQTATWAQIAEKSNLDLWDFKVNEGISESVMDSGFAKNKAFWIAWENFIKSHDEIAEMLTNQDMLRLYNTETNTINKDAREEFIKSDIMVGRSTDEIDNIYKTLLTFSDEYDNALKHLVYQAKLQEWGTNDTIRNYAIWAVIDNVRNIFSDIVDKWKSDSKFKWFEFNENEPVKREWNNIIIYGRFNWADIKIRYDLISGWLFMNSFLSYSWMPENFSIWNDNEARHKIWQLDSFDKILNDNYNLSKFSNSHSRMEWTGTSVWQNNWLWWEWDSLAEYENSKLLYNQNSNNEFENTPSEGLGMKPTISQSGAQYGDGFEYLRKAYWDMLNSNIDLIGNAIYEAEKQSTINSAVIKFMKTFNIIPTEWEFKSFDVEHSSNIFNVIKIIENTVNSSTEGVKDLEYFSNTFMPKIMEYSCLKWWENNLEGPKEDSENRDMYNITFNENNNNQYISLIRESANDFSQNLNKFQPENTRNYDSSYNLWFADFIEKNFIIWEKPDWKLSYEKMAEFIDNLENNERTS